MGNAVVIKTELPPGEAAALLAALKAGYSAMLHEHWYDDAYRFVPDTERHKAILSRHPVMAAQKRLIGALSLSLQKAN